VEHRGRDAAVDWTKLQFLFNLADNALAERFGPLAVAADEEKRLPGFVPLGEPSASSCALSRSPVRNARVAALMPT
jgi:hypothetical protein